MKIVWKNLFISLLSYSFSAYASHQAVMTGQDFLKNDVCIFDLTTEALTADNQRTLSQDEVLEICALRIKEHIWEEVKKQNTLNKKERFERYIILLASKQREFKRNDDLYKKLITALEPEATDTSAEKELVSKWQQWVMGGALFSTISLGIALFSKPVVTQTSNALHFRHNIISGLSTALSWIGMVYTVGHYIHAQYSLWSKKRAVPDIEAILAEKRRKLEAKYPSAMVSL